jgi:hypothetical protein
MTYVKSLVWSLVIVSLTGFVVLAQDSPPATQPAAAVGQRDAMLALLDVERQSRATYYAILERHRPIHPFGMILRQEWRHDLALVNQLMGLNVTVPANAWAGKPVDVPEDLDKARALGAELERKTIAAYVRAIEATPDGALKRQLVRMQRESEHHLWMFENCDNDSPGSAGFAPGGRRGAGRNGGSGPGPGIGRR